VAVHAALLARKAGRPVRLIYDRHEDLAATTKRHPGVIRHRTGRQKGWNTASFRISRSCWMAGHTATLTPVVLSRAAIHAAGAYSCPNVRIRGRGGRDEYPAQRGVPGFGAPQSLFAAELMVEHVAERLGMSSVDLRRQWMLRLGEHYCHGSGAHGECGF